MLELRGITKRFGPVVANDGIDLDVPPGSLHAVLGENGAGKSTLMKILSGFLPPDAGRIRLDGHEVPTGSPRAALRAGIGMLHQDPLVCLPFTALDNFILGREGKIDRAAARGELREVCARFDFDIDPDARARSLSVGERQQLEIARLLSLGVKVLILDEPTSGISSEQRTKLFSALRTLAGEGLIVLFVSHKLEEVEELCDTVTVIRAGRVVGERALPCPADELVELMFGDLVVSSARPPVEIGAPALRVSGLAAGTGRQAITGVDLEVRAGEVVGLAGLEGSGQRTLLRVLAGLEPARAGHVEIDGCSLDGSSYEGFVSAGVHYLPAGRLEEGLVPGLTIAEHLTLAARLSDWVVDWDAARSRAEEAIEHFRIKGGPDTPADALSGGNQQRLLLAMMPEDLRVLLMEHPTRGLDIESADYVWTRLLARRDSGTAIVFSSADLDELVGYADRVVVFFSGKVLADLPAAALTADRLGTLIGGKVAS